MGLNNKFTRELIIITIIIIQITIINSECYTINDNSYCCPCSAQVFYNNYECCCESQQTGVACPPDDQCCVNGGGTCCSLTRTPTPSRTRSISHSPTPTRTPTPSSSSLFTFYPPLCLAQSTSKLVDANNCVMLLNCSSFDINAKLEYSFQISDSNFDSLFFYLVTSSPKCGRNYNCYIDANGNKPICGSSVAEFFSGTSILSSYASNLELWVENPTLFNDMEITGSASIFNPVPSPSRSLSSSFSPSHSITPSTTISSSISPSPSDSFSNQNIIGSDNNYNIIRDILFVLSVVGVIALILLAVIVISYFVYQRKKKLTYELH